MLTNHDFTRSLIQQASPTFLVANDVYPIMLESKEAICIRAILALNLDNLGLSNDALENKFRSLLILLAHEVFSMHHTWLLKEYYSTIAFHQQAIDNFLTEVRSLFQESYITPLQYMTDVNEKYIAFVNRVRHFYHLRQTYFPGKFVFDEIRFNETIATARFFINLEYYHEEDCNAEGFLDSVATRITDFCEDMYLKKLLSINDELIFENSATLSDLLVTDDGTTLFDVKHENNTHYDMMLLRHHRWMIGANTSYLLDDTKLHLKKYFPHLGSETLEGIFSKAILNLTAEIGRVERHLLAECHLQQLRKPHLSSQLFTTIRFFLIRNNEEAQPDDDCYNAITEYCTGCLQNGVDFTSLQTLVINAHHSLHSPIVVESESPSGMSLGSVSLSNPLHHVQRNTVSAPLRLANGLSDFMLTTKKPPRCPTPNKTEDLNLVDITILNEKCRLLPKYKNIFEEYNDDPDATMDAADRHDALVKFRYNLLAANSIIEIAALVEAAKPYINRHRHYWLDRLLGNQNTKKWKKAVKEARIKSLVLLKESAEENLLTPAVLEGWRNNKLFAEHRQSFKLLGGFGKTQSQKDIDVIHLTYLKNK